MRDDGQSSESWEAELTSAQATAGYQLKSGTFVKGTCYFVAICLVVTILVFAFYGVVSCFRGDSKAEAKPEERADPESQPLVQDDKLNSILTDKEQPKQGVAAK